MTISQSIYILAPADRVWETLLDFKAYKEWNSFVDRVEFVSDQRSTEPSADQTPAVGRKMVIYPVNLSSITATMHTLDPANFRVAWETVPVLPKWALHADRWQTLTREEVDGEMMTKYQSFEVFSGVLAYIIRWFLKKQLNDGVRSMAEALKTRSEGI
ncbi:unnamed protein product [Mycena citricolor]|uniref:Coenzyme Q-binding protein COQ10 START domain-containing protein n=1 Tax=Mycena citricolor TaxID=2018698 RepID=A0AAD2Q438_9AGAR|nr:unnamed protein product [Mycena citricolor]